MFWQTSSQVLLYDIVGPENLPSAVRLNATARYLGVFIGPAVGGAMLLLFSPTVGIFINTTFYLPLLLWLVGAPYGRKFRSAPAMRRAVKGFADLLPTLRDIRAVPVIGMMLGKPATPPLLLLTAAHRVALYSAFKLISTFVLLPIAG